MLNTFNKEFACTDHEGDNETEQAHGICDQVKCPRLFCTMEVFSMIKHTIVSEDSNPICRYFEIGRQTGSCGPEMIWKIYQAVRIDDKKEASVFIFDKKIADKLHKPRRRETVSEILRHEVHLLENIKHNKILSVVHPLEECRNSIAFASEPVLASLANLLGNYERLPAQLPQEIKDYEFLEFEIQYGILQITEALSFLHGSEQLIHRNVCPQSILVTQKGTWKLAGLGFSEKVRDGKESSPCHAWGPKIPKMAQPDLNYIAPEIQTSKMCNFVSDMFSVGMVICTIYNEGIPMIEAEHNSATYIKQLDQLTQKFGDVAHRMPLPLVEPVEKMINKDIRYRPTAQLFSLLKMFHDPVIATLQQLDNLDYKDPAQRIDVYTLVAQNLSNIPKKTVYRHVFPVLCLECSAAETVTSALYPFITMINNATKDEYADIILPTFRHIIDSPKPVQATVYILDKLGVILAKSPSEEIRSELIPLVFNSLESNSLQAQEAALNAIGIIKEYLDDSVMRSMVLPRAKALYNKSSNVRARINSLYCIDHLLDSLDKMTILDEVLPFLTEITSCQDASIVMVVVGIYKHMLSDKKFGLTHNLIATKVMPPLVPHTVNPGFSMEQFGALMEVLREMLSQIDRKRRNKMKEETLAAPFPQRGSINMPVGEAKSKEEKGSTARNYLSVQDAVSSGIQKSRTEFSFTSLLKRDRSRSKDIAVTSLQAPNSPEHQQSKDEKQFLTLDKQQETQRRFSLVPPGGGNPGISLIADDSPVSDRPRRPSTQSLGQYSVPDFDRKGSRGNLFGLGESKGTHRRASFQALGETVMQLFSGK